MRGWPRESECHGTRFLICDQHSLCNASAGSATWSGDAVGRDAVSELCRLAPLVDAGEGRTGTRHAPTAQHAHWQGNVVGDNIAASLGHGEARAYRHKDLGVVADLVGVKAGAKPLGIELTGLPAKAVAGGYGAALVRRRDDRSPQPVPPRQRPSAPARATCRAR